MGHVEPIREKLVVNILNRFLQGGDVPLACDLLLDAALSSTSGSWVPAVDAEPFSVQVNGWARCCRSDTLEKMNRVFWRMLRGILREPF